MPDTKNRESATPVVVGPFVRHEILARLRAALATARDHLGERWDDVRRLAREVVERIDGLELTATVAAASARMGQVQPAAVSNAAHEASVSCKASASPADADQVVSCLHRIMPANAGGEPVTEFLLVPFGEVEVERPTAGGSFTFTPAHAASARQWFERMGRKLAIDYEHQSFDRLNPRPDGLRPAAGWIGGLEVRESGLWAVDVTWTERALALLRSGEYRYFSPVIYWTDAQHADVAALGPVALTNDPAMRGVTPLATSRNAAVSDPRPVPERRAEGSDPATVSDLRLAGSDPAFGPRGPVSDPAGGCVATAAAVLDEGQARDLLNAARAEVTVLRGRLAAHEADAFVERGLRAGKIVASTMNDWRADHLRDPRATEERLSRAPVLLPPGRFVATEFQNSASGAHRVGGLRLGGPSGAAVVEVEDLETYERAAAAGRVVWAGR